MHNKLFKLRFKLVDELGKTHGLTPIKYRDPVSLIYNVSGRTVAINHDGHVNVLTNRKDVVFQLVNQKQPSSTSQIDLEANARVLIKCGLDGDRYLHVAPTGSRIETTAKMADASIFIIKRHKGCGPLWRFDNVHVHVHEHEHDDKHKEESASWATKIRRALWK